MARDPIADLIDLGGAGIAVVELDEGRGEPTGPGVVRLGVHRMGSVPGGALGEFHILLRADPAAPGPWVGVGPERLNLVIAELRGALQRASADPVMARAVQVRLVELEREKRALRTE